MHPYRVFVSYSHEDRELAERLVGHLRAVGLHPMWDRDLRPADRFTEVIKEGIAHAHVIVPIFTNESMQRPWVNQETGYAMGLEVPVLPITVGSEPAAMTRELQGMRVGPNLENLRPEALAKAIEDLLARKRPKSEGTVRCAASPAMRADYLGSHTLDALRYDAFGPLRQLGAFSSFNLPRIPPDDEIWKLRDAPVVRDRALHELLYEERQTLHEYAARHGCDLIICPSLRLRKYGPAARRLRLQTLLEFLEDTAFENVRVAVRKREPGHNLTIVGDWFLAESFSPRPGKGYFHTNFTWHAPTVLQRLRTFGRDFEILISKAEATGRSSREVAIDAVKEAITAISE